MQPSRFCLSFRLLAFCSTTAASLTFAPDLHPSVSCLLRAAVHLSKLLEHLLRQREADYRAARSGGCCGGAGEPPALPHSLSLCLYFLPPTE